VGNRLEAHEQVQHRLNEIAQKIKQHRQRIDELSEIHNLTRALGDIQQLEWFLTHVSDLPVSENFAWITGWTNDVNGTDLSQMLEKTAARAVVHYPPPPIGSKSPMVMHNPGWSRPFELFTRLLGTPARDEMDPSILLMIIVPLLFGYMFGDVGHGLVFFMAGILLQKRWPLLKILISCGAASMVFGFIFGSVFSSEQIIEPLWVNPIEQPLIVLFLPMIGGVVILLLGLFLNSVQAYWRGEMKHWLLVDAAVIVMYLGIIGSFIHSWFVAAFIFGLCWYFAGSAVMARGHIMQALGTALGQLLENLLQLLINTISFIRVGAFALAHAGLSLAVMVLANTADNYVWTGIVMVTGNIIILVLEGMVVSIQTTRLVLFEFFIRFLRGTGRVFRPLTAPQTPKQHLSKNNQGEHHGHV
jgi:V/A-type H+-transporting ATPase subunit I